MILKFFKILYYPDKLRWVISSLGNGSLNLLQYILVVKLTQKSNLINNYLFRLGETASLIDYFVALRLFGKIFKYIINLKASKCANCQNLINFVDINALTR